MNQLRYLWQFAMIAYDRPSGSDPLFKDCVSYTAMNRDLDFGFIAEYKDEIIIAYRGTGTRSSDGVKCIKTWMSDFDLYPLRSEQDMVRKGRDNHSVLVNSEILSDGVWGKGTIHNGFYTTWSKFKEEVSYCSEKFKGKPIYCVGHSRGGALTELCARHLAKNKGLSCSCMEYGTPSVGTKDYIDQFRTLPIESVAIINGYDIVPELPPESLGFHHAPIQIIKMRQPWWHKYFYRVRDHFQENYTSALEKYYP